MKITTNHQYRNLQALADLPHSVRADFNYVPMEDGYYPRFFRYRGAWYDSQEFIEPAPEGWHGFQSDTFFSGVLIRFSPDYEQVMVGTLTT